MRSAAGALALALTGGILVPTAAHAAEGSADLSVSVSHAPTAVTAGDEVVFTITATNDGPDAAVGVVAGIAAQYPLGPVAQLPEGCRRAANYESIVCELGTVAAGQSATVAIAMRAQGSGLYTVPVAISSDTPDPDTDDLVATTVLLVKRGPSHAERYIAGIFPMVLDRPADAASLAFWSARWQSAITTWPRNLTSVPLGIINSGEHRRLRVRDSYQRILGRSADPASLAYWVGRAGAGFTFERIEQLIVGSSEFARKSSADRIGAVYQAVLGRAPSGSERSRWNAAFGSTGNLGILAALLQRTSDGYDVVINQKFQATFGAPAGSFARFIWQVRLREGSTPEQLWSQLLVSNDVLRLYPYTEDDYLEEEMFWDMRAAVPQIQAALAG